MNTEEINIVFTLSDKTGNYSATFGTTIASIFENTDFNKVVINIHIMHDDTLTIENKRNFEKLISYYRQNVQFYNIKLDWAKFKNLDCIKKYTIAQLYRIMIADTIKVDKVIYLDSDLIFNLDIRDLNNEELDGKSIGAVLDKYVKGIDVISKHEYVYKIPVNVEEYFNTGVIIFDLKKIREKYDTFSEGIQLLKKYPFIPYGEQDINNMLFVGDCKFIDKKYNWGNVKGKRDNCIYHFSVEGNKKPWCNNTTTLNELYWQYFAKTPWGNTIDKLLTAYNKSIILDKKILINPILSKKIFIKNCLQRILKEFLLRFRKR